MFFLGEGVLLEDERGCCWVLHGNRRETLLVACLLSVYRLRTRSLISSM